MALVVFDSDVLIAFLNRDDANHEPAVQRMREAWTPGTSRWLCAANYSEILIGPLMAGAEATVTAMVVRFGIEIKQVDMALAERVAAVRARTGLKLPDAYALATAIHAEHRNHRDVQLASFDERLLKAHASLHAG